MSITNKFKYAQKQSLSQAPKNFMIWVGQIESTMYDFHDSTDIFVNPSFLPFCTQKAH